MFFHLGHIFCLGVPVRYRGGSLGVHRGRVMLITNCFAEKLYVEEGPRGSNGAHSTLCRILVTPSATHNQTGPL